MKKYRPAAIVLSILLFSVLAFPAERKFDITISLEGGSARIDRTEAVARVRVTNRSREDLRLGGLGELNLYFSTCQPGDPSCDGSELYYSRVTMPSATVFTDRSYEFRVDLTKLWWKKGPYNPQIAAPSYNLEAVPSANIFFYGDVKILDGFVADDDTGKREPEYLSYLSNTITAILQ